MTTKNFTQEQISAFADGELADDQIDAVLAALKTADGRNAWASYHEIGDVMRSDDMAAPMSSDFAARFMARLDEEPTVVAPIVATQVRREAQKADRAIVVVNGGRKRFALSGMAAAAVAALAFVAVPQIMVATKAGPAVDGAAMVVTASAAQGTVAAGVETTGENGEILRNADVDEYLVAHQRFSPSVYSTAQYARSATFAVDSDK